MSWGECCGCAMAFYAACQRHMSGDQVQCQFLVDRNMLKHLFYTKVNGNNFTLLSLCSMWLLFWRLGRHPICMRP